MNRRVDTELSPKLVSKILSNAYPKCGLFAKVLVKWRPFICPFHEIVKFVPSNGSVLEVGCGVGLMSVLLANLGMMRYGVGIDISESAIKVAKQAVFPKECDLSFQHIGEDETWPGGFDTIVCIDVLHHIARWKQHSFIKQLASAYPGKTIVFKDISPKPLWKAATNTIHDLVLSHQRISIRSEKEVENWFKDEGLSIVRNVRMDTLWYSHYLIVAKKGSFQKR